MNPSVNILARMAMAEGFSLLILMGVGMPLKYALGIPEFVKVFGWVHGILFISFCVILLRTTLSSKIPFLSSALILISAFIPGGNFWADRHLRQF